MRHHGRADRAGCCRTERRGAPLGHLCACNTTVGSAVAGGGNGRCADTRGQTRYAHHASDRARRRSDWRGRWAVAPVTTTVAPVTAPVIGVTAPVPVTGVTAPVPVTGVTAQPNAVTAPPTTAPAPVTTT